ncbi:MAG: carboxymuconolactone decarboxylase family protein [Gammaproteobacteria bacterium]
MAAGENVIDHAQRRRRGLELYREIMQQAHPEPDSPRAAGLIDFVFAEIWARPGLSRRERRLIALSCAGGADARETLADHVYAALKSGDFSRAEMDEVILHFAVYCGWPKAEVFERIMDAQVARIGAETGALPPRRAPAPLTSVSPDQELRKQGGEQEFRDVNVAPAPPRGVPYYDDGILNYVFGDMWKRPGLSRRDRRWVTLACVGLDDTHVPIRSHVYSAMKSGDCSYDEMREMVLQFAAHSGWPKASFMQQVVDEEHARVVREAGGSA